MCYEIHDTDYKSGMNYYRIDYEKKCLKDYFIVVAVYV